LHQKLKSPHQTNIIKTLDPLIHPLGLKLSKIRAKKQLYPVLKQELDLEHNSSNKNMIVVVLEMALPENAR